MRRAALAAASIAALALAAPAAAQDQAAVYQQKKAFRFAGDSLARYEWTQDIPSADGLVNENRSFLQARPRVELTMGPVELGVGGAFNYSDEENDVPPPGQELLLIIRDNYRSRDARLDLAWGKLTMGPVVLEGGRFLMPIPFTEMIWDRDLRPQGGAVALQYVPKSSASRFALNGIYATGSHVYEDESVMYGGGLDLTFAAGQESSLQLVGSYLQFEDLDKLEPQIRRQNTRVAGLIVHDYHVVDLIARIHRGGRSRSSSSRTTPGTRPWTRTATACGSRPCWATSASRGPPSRTPTPRSTRTRPWPPSAPTTSSGAPAGRATGSTSRRGR